MNLDIIFNKIKKILPKKWYWILEHEGFRKYFANTGWMFFGRFFNLLISFFVGIWIIRYLGPKNYGTLSYVVSLVGLFSVFSGLGIDNILKRELVNCPEKRDLLLGTSFVMKLFGSFLAILFSFVTIFLLESYFLIRLLSVIYSFGFILQSFNILDLFFQAKVQTKRSVKAQIFASIISAVLKVVLIYLGLGIIWLVVIYVLDILWISIGYIYNYKKMGLSLKKWEFDINMAKKIFSDSWLLIFTGFSVLIYMKIDQVMIKRMMDESFVGLYSASVRIMELTYIVPSIICSSLAPAIFNARKGSLKIYKSRVNNLLFFLFCLSVLIALPISIFSKYIISFLFGGDYLGAILSLSIGVWALIGVSLSTVINQYFIAEKKIKIIFLITFLGAIINVILNYILMPVYGINGAAFVTVFSYLIVFVLGFLFRKK
ncbi:flippase [bacterium]|nr:flippase [bacterium]